MLPEIILSGEYLPKYGNWELGGRAPKSSEESNMTDNVFDDPDRIEADLDAQEKAATDIELMGV